MNLDAWIGRTRTDSDVVTPTPYAGLSAVLDRGLGPPAGGHAPAPTPQSGQVEPPARQAPGRATWTRGWKADHVLLFRYSALTFNGHRIHYDRRYATEVEGYPGLVVHGPLLATLLLDLVHRERPEFEVARFEFRAMRPVFDLHPFEVCGEPQSDGAALRLWVRDHAGALAMDATAHLADGHGSHCHS